MTQNLLGSVRARAKEGLLAAHRNGQLEILAAGMEEAEAKLEQAENNLLSIKEKARKGLSRGLKDGSLEKIAAGMEDAIGEVHTFRICLM